MDRIRAVPAPAADRFWSMVVAAAVLCGAAIVIAPTPAQIVVSGSLRQKLN
jgi:hypothetical protein